MEPGPAPGTRVFVTIENYIKPLLQPWPLASLHAAWRQIFARKKAEELELALSECRVVVEAVPELPVSAKLANSCWLTRAFGCSSTANAEEMKKQRQAKREAREVRKAAKQAKRTTKVAPAPSDPGAAVNEMGNAEEPASEALSI